MRTFLFSCFHWLTFLCLFVNCSEKEVTRPNILWIVSEDNSPFLGAYGDEYATTPNLDLLAAKGVLYTNAFAPAPVCAPTRSSIITGMYANSLGTHHMRSNYASPDFVRFYPEWLQQAGYYCTNNSKKDYNTPDQSNAWNESGNKAHYKNRKPGQPFFHIYNLGISHESSIHQQKKADELRHDPEKAPIPPYHPHTPEMKHDWAQYYDEVEDMDHRVGEILKELEDSGEAENTIVFYYSDHGGILGRSKRFMYESGLRVPLIISFPEKYRHLSDQASGSQTDRLVNLVDMAPTALDLAGADIPEYMQGKSVLAKDSPTPDYTYGFRGRMDERFDMVRSVRSKQYRYIRNYMPHRIYGQYIEYLWRAPSMQSWENAYHAGQLNATQAAFWEEKPAEELYDISGDPHNVKNLASDPAYREVLDQLRNECIRWQKEIRDVGIIPEPMMEQIAENQTLYDYIRQNSLPYDFILETADIATRRNPEFANEIQKRLTDNHPAVRYWALVGCALLPQATADSKSQVAALTQDTEVAIKVAAAEALYRMGEKQMAIETLIQCLKSPYQMGRTMALNVLEIMGDEARPALPAVQQLVPQKPNRKFYDVRAAQRLLEKLTTQ